MFRMVFVLAGLVLVAGCGEARKAVGAGGVAPMEVRVLAKATPTLALEHTLVIEAAQDRIAAVFGAAQAACKAGAADGCELLESRIDTGRFSHASLKFRASPDGVRKLIAALGQQGEVVSQSTVSEDLAAPIADVDKKLAMLGDYRAKLEALRARAASDVDALIKVNRELAQVQSELEAAMGTQANLTRRVRTELLNVTINRTLRGQAFWQPVADAGASFGEHLAEGMATTITATAFLPPWIALLAVLAWIGRRLWRRSRAKAAAAPVKQSP